MLSLDSIQASMDTFCYDIGHEDDVNLSEYEDPSANPPILLERYLLDFSNKHIKLHLEEQYIPHIVQGDPKFEFRKLLLRFYDSSTKINVRFHYHPEGTVRNHYDHHDFFHIHNLDTTPETVFVFGDKMKRPAWKQGASGKENSSLNLVWCGELFLKETDPIFFKNAMYRFANSTILTKQSVKKYFL